MNSLLFAGLSLILWFAGKSCYNDRGLSLVMVPGRSLGCLFNPIGEFLLLHPHSSVPRRTAGFK